MLNTTAHESGANAGYGRINQSIFDESQITEEQPSFYDPKAAEQQQREARTGKYKSSDLRPDPPGRGDPKDVGEAEPQEQSKRLLGDDLGEQQKEADDQAELSFKSADSIEKMSAAQTEVLSVQLNKAHFETLDKLRTYLAFVCLILISISSLMQKSAISYMYSYQHPVDAADGHDHSGAVTKDNFTAHENGHYNIRDEIEDLTLENFGYLAGDFFTILYAFMVLFTGSASDIFNRKKLLLWTCFGWCICTYLSSFVQDF